MKGMSIIVKTVSHWMSAFIFLYGLSIVFYGHLTPGGGFPGGGMGGMGDTAHWISALNEAGCAPFDPENDLIESGPPQLE